MAGVPSTMPPGKVPRDVTERILKVEIEQKRSEERLREGAQTFGEIKNAITAINSELIRATAPKPIPLWRVIGVFFGIATAIGTWIWQASKYPDRSEYNAAAKEQNSVNRELASELKQMQIKQTIMSSEIGAIKDSQERQEKAQSEIRDMLRKRRR